MPSNAALGAAALVAVAYLIGSVSFGLLVARRAGVDLRAQGSGNVGATNVKRVLGKGPGRLVLALDALKGLVPVAAAAAWFGTASPVTLAAGMAAAIGHCFPLWHGFRGGKAAATAAGALLAAYWPAGLAAGLTYFVVRRVSRRSSVGSLTGALVGAGVTGGALPSSDPRVALAVGLLTLVVARHHENIRRLLAGEEPPG